VAYHSAHLRDKFTLAWRIRLRETYKMVKQARMIYRFYIARRAWQTWTDRFAERRREKKFKDLEKARLRKAFTGEINRLSHVATASNDCSASVGHSYPEHTTVQAR
jgi:hypothetical protein